MYYMRRLNKLFWVANVGLAIALIVVASSLLDTEEPVRDDSGVLLQAYAKRRPGAVDGNPMSHGDPSLIVAGDIFGLEEKQARLEPSAASRELPKPEPVVRKPVPFRSELRWPSSGIFRSWNGQAAGSTPSRKNHHFHRQS